MVLPLLPPGWGIYAGVRVDPVRRQFVESLFRAGTPVTAARAAIRGVEFLVQGRVVRGLRENAVNRIYQELRQASSAADILRTVAKHRIPPLEAFAPTEVRLRTRFRVTAFVRFDREISPGVDTLKSFLNMDERITPDRMEKLVSERIDAHMRSIHSDIHIVDVRFAEPLRRVE